MKVFIGANLKMNKTYSELLKYNLELEKKYNKSENIELMISPDFVSLNIFSENKNISLSAQNMSSKNNGAFTGEISVEMIKDINCKYVILGHSEVRKNLSESSELINKKAKLALKNNITPIICISEKEQLLESIKDILNTEIIIAYEPLSAIGTGKIDSISDISKNINFIKNKLNNKNSRIIYGGSVNSKNCLEISKINHLNGFLIGGACLEVDSLLEIVVKIKK